MSTSDEKRAVVLLSGGIDSTTTAYYAKSKNYKIYALTIDYGQRLKKEIVSAKKIAMHLSAQHLVIPISLDLIGGSALTNKSISVPQNRKYEDIEAEIPITYVPCRNIIMLSIACAWAEVIDAEAVFIGANAVDYSGYPDCRPEFIDAFQKMISIGTRRGVERKTIKVEAPLINMKKSEIVKLGVELGVPYELTWSCYLGKEKACGRCDSCMLRLKAFKDVGIDDPLDYEVRI